ncbi:MAG: TonB-dependent receptor, partial [Deltaproteobacteria bacterium]|nr:TonB-dependent receptor [Deltaproteobacteria bacterium]
FSLTGFYMDVDDYINKGDDDTFQNNEKYRFRGFEMALERRFTEDLMVRAGYTFLDAEDRSSGSGKSEVAYNPKHRITVEGAYCFESGLTLYLNTVYGGKQYYYSRKGPVLKDELDDYTLANVKLSQKLLRDRVEVYLGVDNIGDEDYEQNYGLPQAGRFFYAGMEARF